MYIYVNQSVHMMLINTLITCTMVIQILLYTGSSCTDKLTYIFSKRTHFNEQLMLLGFEIVYINKCVILTRHKSAIHNILITEILSICYNIILHLYHTIFKYCVSIILTDIIICSICKTLYVYVSSVYTVMWYAILCPLLCQSIL